MFCIRHSCPPTRMLYCLSIPKVEIYYSFCKQYEEIVSIQSFKGRQCLGDVMKPGLLCRQQNHRGQVVRGVKLHVLNCTDPLEPLTNKSS